MSDFLSGIGFAKDLEQIEITTEGYPVLRPGYAYIENKEYYIFASGIVSQISPSGFVEDTNYIPGSSYFIVNQMTDVDNLQVDYTNIAKVLDISKNLISDVLPSGWSYNENTSMYDFNAPNFAGKYLVFDTSDRFTVVKDFVEDTLLVISDVDTGEPFGTDNKPIWLSAGNIGREIPFYARVSDENGSLLINKMIEWYKVYTKPSGIPPSGVTLPSGLLVDEEVVKGPYEGEFGDYFYDIRLKTASDVTDDNGVSRVNVIPVENEQDLFLYAKSGDAWSKLIWLQVHIESTERLGVFQLDNISVFLGCREAMTAIGFDAWNVFWTDMTYDTTVTGNPDYSTREDWKTGFPEYERPPVASSSGIDENLGYFNGSDYRDTYHVTWDDTDIIDFMRNKRVAVKGYWGQVLISGAQIRSGQWDAGIQNTTDDKYTIDVQPSTDPNDPTNHGYLQYPNYFGLLGDWNDIRNEPTAKYDNLFFVLYSKGYEGNDINWFKTHDFYFRGTAIPNMNPNSPDFMNQDYELVNFISESELQEF